MTHLESTVRFICLSVSLIGFASCALSVLVAGSYLIMRATPCLCFQANGFMLLAGLMAILLGTVMIVWSRDLATKVTAGLMKRLFPDVNAVI